MPKDGDHLLRGGRGDLAEFSKQERAESIVVADADGPAAATAALASPPVDVVAAMQRHRVLPPRTIYIEKCSSRAH